MELNTTMNLLFRLMYPRPGAGFTSSGVKLKNGLKIGIKTMVFAGGNRLLDRDVCV